MKVRVPGDVLAFEIRSGHVSLDARGTSSFGLVGGAVGGMAVEGFEKARQREKLAAGLRFPPFCCNCLATGSRVRSVESVSTVNRVVDYTFRFRVPHCSGCAPTANRRRPGLLGTFAAFLAISVLVFIVLLGIGSATNRNDVILLSLVAAPALGIALPLIWTKLRRSGPDQSSWYQAVYASAIDVDFSGVPQGFTLTFENAGYGERFVALNRELGVHQPEGGLPVLKFAIPVLHVESSEAAERFYLDGLGFRRRFAYRLDETHENRPDPCYMGISRDEVWLHLSSFSGDGVSGGVVYIAVEDVDGLHAELVAKGVRIDTGPVDQTWGNREMYVKDPDGNSVRFIQEGASET